MPCLVPSRLIISDMAWYNAENQSFPTGTQVSIRPFREEGQSMSIEYKGAATLPGDSPTNNRPGWQWSLRHQRQIVAFFKMQ